jgi:Xaa-Pro aminopeptidase
MNSILTQNSSGTDAGRLGHGVGMSLTEWPSLIPDDHTVLEKGMVLSLEPGIAIKDKIIVHEENIEITETGARYLSPKANKDLSII